MHGNEMAQNASDVQLFVENNILVELEVPSTNLICLEPLYIFADVDLDFDWTGFRVSHS